MLQLLKMEPCLQTFLGHLGQEEIKMKMTTLVFHFQILSRLVKIQRVWVDLLKFLNTVRSRNS